MVFDEVSFEYGNFKSDTYGLVFAHIDTSEFNNLAGEIGLNTVFNKKNRRQSLISRNYSNACLSFEVEIIKIPACNTSEIQSTYIDYDDGKIIERALFNKGKFDKLILKDNNDTSPLIETVTQVGFGVTKYGWNDVKNNKRIVTYSTDENKRLFLNCAFINPVRLIDGIGRTIGYKCTIECSSNMFTQESIIHIANTFDQSNYFPINVLTDEDEYIYPEVTITPNGTNPTFKMVNESDDSKRVTQFVDVKTAFTINGEYNTVTGNMYNNFKIINFPRLKPGYNIFRFEGELLSVKFEFNCKRYLF